MLKVCSIALLAPCLPVRSATSTLAWPKACLTLYMFDQCKQNSPTQNSCPVDIATKQQVQTGWCIQMPKSWSKASSEQWKGFAQKLQRRRLRQLQLRRRLQQREFYATDCLDDIYCSSYTLFRRSLIGPKSITLTYSNTPGGSMFDYLDYAVGSIICWSLLSRLLNGRCVAFMYHRACLRCEARANVWISCPFTGASTHYDMGYNIVLQLPLASSFDWLLP